MINMAINYIERSAAVQAAIAGNTRAAISQVQDLVEKFSAARSKRNSLIDLKPAFENLIAAVDREYKEAEEKVHHEMTALQPLLSIRLIASRKAEKEVERIVEEIEQANYLNESGGALLQMCKKWVECGLVDGDPAEAELNKHQELMAALITNKEALRAAQPVLNQIDDLESTLNHCSQHRVKVRYAWADVLAQGGKHVRSQNIILEAMSIQMGLPVEELKRSRKRRSERERERAKEGGRPSLDFGLSLNCITAADDSIGLMS